MIDRSERKRYNDLIGSLKRDYGFEGFVHYTAYDNLKSILDSGFIMSRKEMEQKGNGFLDVAEHRVLEDTPPDILDKVRLSYGFNTPITYHFEKTAMENGSEMVAIVVDPEIVFKYDVEFYEKSAARSSYGEACKTIEAIEGYNWDEIFGRGKFGKNYIDTKRYRDAELVVDGKVSAAYILKVYFRSEEFRTRATTEMGRDYRFRLGKIEENKHFSPGV